MPKFIVTAAVSPRELGEHIRMKLDATAKVEAYGEARPNGAKAHEAETQIEARNRALVQVERRLRDVDHALQRHNYGVAADAVEALREDVGGDFGVPYVVRKELDGLSA